MIEQLAMIQTELFDKPKFRQIGNIYRRREEPISGDVTQENSAGSWPNPFYVERIVSNPFILKSAFMEVANRGPFRTTANWLSAQLQNVGLDCERLQKSSNENDFEAAERSGEIARRLLALLPRQWIRRRDLSMLRRPEPGEHFLQRRRHYYGDPGLGSNILPTTLGGV